MYKLLALKYTHFYAISWCAAEQEIINKVGSMVNVRVPVA